MRVIIPFASAYTPRLQHISLINPKHAVFTVPSGCQGEWGMSAEIRSHLMGLLALENL